MSKRTSLKIISRVHVFLYKWTRGLIGNSVAGVPVLLLTITGRRTGKRQTVPLGYLKEDPSYVLIASNGGQDAHPDWVFNLRSNPRATIEVRRARMAVEARHADSDERIRLWADIADKAPVYLRYRRQTAREIPMLFLRPQT